MYFFVASCLIWHLFQANLSFGEIGPWLEKALYFTAIRPITILISHVYALLPPHT